MTKTKNGKKRITINGKILSTNERYEFYEASVQNPKGDIDFISSKFKKLYGTPPISLREDFAGTSFLTCEWVKTDKQRISFGIDLDQTPLEYGRRTHYETLTADQKKRVQIIQGNVLDNFSFKTDIIVAFNFSYYIFKTRAMLIHYFSKVRQGLNYRGMFFLDLFGGTEGFQVLEEQSKKEGFTYIWDCQSFNVVNHECQYYIHFEVNGVRYERAFSYDWRMWTMVELREILIEAGFSKTFVYWEGDDGKGGGDGKFALTNEAENCLSWVAYIAAIP